MDNDGLLKNKHVTVILLGSHPAGWLVEWRKSDRRLISLGLYNHHFEER